MSNRETQIATLEEAQRHIAQGDHHIAKQESLIAELDRKGHDTKEASRLLQLLRDTQRQHIEHRDRIVLELAK